MEKELILESSHKALKEKLAKVRKEIRHLSKRRNASADLQDGNAKRSAATQLERCKLQPLVDEDHEEDEDEKEAELPESSHESARQQEFEEEI